MGPGRARLRRRRNRRRAIEKEISRISRSRQVPEAPAFAFFRSTNRQSAKTFQTQPARAQEQSHRYPVSGKIEALTALLNFSVQPRCTLEIIRTNFRNDLIHRLVKHMKERRRI